MLLGGVLVAQVAVGVAFGQASSTAGTISGTVVDQQGAVISGAAVTVRNVDTGLERSLTSDDSGRFRATTLPVGNYEVTASAQGFGTLKRSGIIVRVGDEVALKLEMTATGTTEVINVTAEAPIAEPAKTQVSTTINEKAIEELPINGRRWSNFVTLTPGVTPDGTFGLISFRGISGLLNNNTIDGADNNQAFFSEERGRTRINYVISQESIKEFQVNTQNYSPEFGRAAGAVVNAVTKSGTNEIHGSAFYYLRDETFNARNPLDFVTVGFNPNGSPIREAIRPPDRRQQFGGSLGGPIKRDHVFWFFSYDQQKRNFPLNAQPSTPSFFTDCTSPSGGLVGAPPAACALAIAYILPQTGVYQRRGDQWLFLPKVDWQVTKNNLFSAAYNYMKWDSPNGIQTQPVVNAAESNNGSDKVRVDILTFRLASTISSTILNEARFQYGRDFESQIPNSPDSVGLNVGSSSGGNSSTGFNMGIAEFLPRAKFPDERKYQFVDNFSVFYGGHTIKVGGDFIRSDDDVDNIRFGRGYYNYGTRSNRPGIANFALDLANPGQRNYSVFRQAFGLAKFKFSTWDLNFFAQDEWKVRQNLTINYGFRYEVITMPETKLPNQLLPETAELPEDRDNFGPRIGFAWDLFNDSKTVLRGGWGIYYGRIINSAIFNALTVTGAPGSTFNLDFSPTAANAPVFPSRLSELPTGATAPRPDTFQFASNLDAPEIHQADLVLEREITRSMSVSFSYLRSRGSHLPFFFDRNLERPNRLQEFLITDATGATQNRINLPIFTAARPNTNFGRIMEQQATVHSVYDAFVLQLNRRLSRGVQVLAHYTVSRARDQNQGSVTFSSSFPTALDQFDLNGEWGRSNFHVRNRFVASFVWEMPFLKDHESAAVRAVLAGWKLNGVVNINDGATVTGNARGSLPSFRAPDGVSVRGISSGPNGSGGSLRVPFVERNSFKQPPLKNFDLRLAKEFRFKERYRLNFVAEAFNLLNRTHFFRVDQNQYELVAVTAPCATGVTGTCQLPAFRPLRDFLTLTGAQSTLYRERQMQFALRFKF
jgi:hypothetical protein